MIKDRVDRVTGARVIRAALPAEAPAITALHARARARYYPNGTPEDGTDWLASWRHAVERPDGQVLCAVERGRITGIASFRRADAAPADTVYLAQFHVDPDLWRRAPAGPCARPVWRRGGWTASARQASPYTSTTTGPAPSVPAWAGPPTRSTRPARKTTTSCSPSR
ncbi:GNAT family N-acetyltransferase [Streptomyces europaeiscabiei]|uniref:GNAT family N-acetyltransferase n=1 Tax=Streptomyces europaeiscabiei TaxID=146819 RepID=UPI002E170554